MIPKKILFCADFSKNSEPARQAALEYAKAFGASVSIVHVIGTWPVHAYKDKVHIDEDATLSCLREPVIKDLEQVADQFRAALGDVTTCVRVGVPAQEIVQMAEEEGTDLIVLGTHGWTGLRHALVGSVTENVVRTAHCHVLIARS